MLTSLLRRSHSWPCTNPGWPSNARWKHLPIPAWSCIDSPLKLLCCRAIALQSSDGAKESWWGTGHCGLNVCTFRFSTETVSVSGCFDLATVQSCRRWGDKEKRKSSYIIACTVWNIFTTICLSGLRIIICSILNILYCSIAKHILKL